VCFTAFDVLVCTVQALVMTCFFQRDAIASSWRKVLFSVVITANNFFGIILPDVADLAYMGLVTSGVYFFSMRAVERSQEHLRELIYSVQALVTRFLVPQNNDPDRNGALQNSAFIRTLARNRLNEILPNTNLGDRFNDQELSLLIEQARSGQNGAFSSINVNDRSAMQLEQVRHQLNEALPNRNLGNRINNQELSALIEQARNWQNGALPIA